MNTLKNNLKKDYSQIPNELITDMSISHGALRVILYLFTKPDNWNVYNKDIQKQLNISGKTLAKYWKELLVSKWLKRTKRPPLDKNLAGGYEYHIGSFAISEESSKKEETYHHNKTKPIKQKETNTLTDRLVFIWNEFAQENGLPSVIKITKSRQSKIDTRKKEVQDLLGVFKVALQIATNSSFLMGLNKRGWKLNFDWLIENDKNIIKVVEGAYND